MNLDVIKLVNISNINIPLLCGNIEKNLDLTVHYKNNVLERCQNTSYISYTPMYREYISLINGFMMYSHMNYDNGESSMT